MHEGPNMLPNRHVGLCQRVAKKHVTRSSHLLLLNPCGWLACVLLEKGHLHTGSLNLGNGKNLSLINSRQLACLPLRSRHEDGDRRTDNVHFRIMESQVSTWEWGELSDASLASLLAARLTGYGAGPLLARGAWLLLCVVFFHKLRIFLPMQSTVQTQLPLWNSPVSGHFHVNWASYSKWDHLTYSWAAPGSKEPWREGFESQSSSVTPIITF